MAARFYSELLGMYRYRVRDEYCLVGAIDGVGASIVNGRMVNEHTGMSYHIIAVKRGLRCGAHSFADKMEYRIEYLNQKEVYIVFESPRGFRMCRME